MELSNTFNFLKEGRFYDLKIVDVQTQEIIYMGKVFCTAQEIDQTLDKEYSINKGVYITENTRNNDYVVL